MFLGFFWKEGNKLSLNFLAYSAMRRLKSWNRARSGAKHLNNIMFTNLQKEDMDEADVTEVTREFIQANNKRGHFSGALGTLNHTQIMTLNNYQSDGY